MQQTTESEPIKTKYPRGYINGNVHKSYITNEWTVLFSSVTLFEDGVSMILLPLAETVLTYKVFAARDEMFRPCLYQPLLSWVKQ